jgi:hypothetical protein
MERDRDAELLAEIGAEPLPDSGFEDESADRFDGDRQDKEDQAE